jgi:hypothetical protein
LLGAYKPQGAAYAPDGRVEAVRQHRRLLLGAYELWERDALP